MHIARRMKSKATIAVVLAAFLCAAGVSGYVYWETHHQPNEDTSVNVDKGDIQTDTGTSNTSKPVAKIPGTLVVDMIPADISDEENSDSEPFLAVNPENSAVMAASAFTPNPYGPDSGLAPIFVSSDSGKTWNLRNTVPSTLMTADMTETAAAQKRLFAAILAHKTFQDIQKKRPVEYRELSSNDVSGLGVMAVTGSRFRVDQPWITRFAKDGVENIFVGSNDFAGRGGHTATLEISSDSGKTFKTIRLETRRTALQDGPSVRTAIANDGTIYVAYFGWRKRNAAIRNSDVVVLRDDHSAAGAKTFTDLKGTDGLPGYVVDNVNIPFNPFVPVLGQERVGSTLSLAVDPNNSGTIYIAWGDQVGDGDIYSVHVRRSTDRGQSWSGDLRRLTNATCAALAINNKGTVGLLYQQVIGTGHSSRWVTHLEQSLDGFVTVRDAVLSTAPADKPDWGGNLPYIGDYNYLLAIGREFRGVFSANNYPDYDDFPNGVKYLRNADFGSKRLLDPTGTKQVQISIDPYYFSVPSI
jgi:hypothetical protein